MQQLIKITSVPMRTMSYTQNARLISSDSVDIERRKALARQMSFQRSAGRNTLPMKDITKINRTFSRRNVAASPKSQTLSKQETAFRQAQSSAASQVSSRQSSAASALVSGSPDMAVSDAAYTEIVAATVSASVAPADISMETSSSYTAERGALEMRVAKGELTFLPPMVMTIVTQYPELHFEYLGDFNYVPPLSPQTGGSINLFT